MKVERRFDKRFDAVEERLEKRLGEQLEKRFERLEKGLGESLEKRIGESLERRLDERLETGLRKATDELKHQAKLNKEKLADQIKKAADGCAASLESIDRKLDALHSKGDTQIADHGAALANHARRISALERDRRT